MPNIAALHPQIVHFVVALGLLGILLRIVSLLGKGAWLNPAAAILLIISAGAGWLAVRSGTEAHGPAERVPGAREAVQTHEDWGKKARNVLLVVGGLEVLGLLFASRRGGKAIRFVSAAAGVVAGFTIYEAAEHGGDLVYNYAGGIGIRSGNPDDLRHLLTAGLFHSARVARDSGRADEAAHLTEELARLSPTDPTIQLLAAESKLKDRGDPAGALAALAQVQVAADDPRLAPRRGILTAQALVASGQPDSAKAILKALAARFPDSRSVKDALDKLK
jgi:uncharacterized membrane protein